VIISFKFPKTFPLVEPSLQKNFLIISLAIDRHCKINKRKRGNIERNKLKKEENYITLCEDAKYN